MGWIRKRQSVKGTRWRASYRRPDGTTASATFDLEREARDWIFTNEGLKATGRWQDTRRSSETLAEFFPHALDARNLKIVSRTDYERTAAKWLLPYLGATQLRRIDRRAIRAWLADIERDGAAPRTRQKAHAILSGTLRIAVDEDILEVNYARGIGVRVERRAEIEPLEEHELWVLADHIDPRYRALVLLLGYGGLRIGEAAGLLVRDIDLMRRVVNVRRNVVEVGGVITPQNTTKGGEVRQVPISSMVADELARHLRIYSDPGDPQALAFPGERGGYLRATLFLPRFLRPAAKAAGLRPTLRTHDLRHTAAAIAIGNGWPDLKISRMLGHTDPGFTARVYGHLLRRDEERYIEAQEAGQREARERASRASQVRRLR